MRKSKTRVISSPDNDPTAHLALVQRHWFTDPDLSLEAKGLIGMIAIAPGSEQLVELDADDAVLQELVTRGYLQPPGEGQEHYSPGPRWDNASAGREP